MVTTSPATNITQTSGKVYGSESFAPEVINCGFFYGYTADSLTKTAYSVPSSSWNKTLTNLTPGATVYFAAFINYGRPTFEQGETLSFNTEPGPAKNHRFDLSVRL